MRFALLLLTACGRIGFDASAGDATPADVALPIAAAIEAESCTVAAPFAVISDPTASGGAYVIDGNIAGVGGSGSASCTFSLAATATMYLWVRTITSDTSTDSFNVSFDGTQYTLEPSECMYGPSWHWGALRGPTMCMPTSLAALLPITLAAGSHTVVLKSREGQSKIDRAILVTDVAYVPSG